MQGIMSQNFDLGPSFHFMKCRNNYFEIILKVYREELMNVHRKFQVKNMRGD